MLGALWLCAPSSSVAQAVVDSVQITPSTRSVWSLPVSGAVLTVGFLAMETDDEVRAWFQGGVQDNPLARGLAGFASPMGSAELAFGLGGVALVSRVVGQERLSDITWHTLESVLATAVVTSLAKGFVGRARPSGVPEWTWHPGQGFTDPAYRSFPSGHSAQAFALATALAAELDHHDVPGAGWMTPTLYSVAGLCGVSRLFDDRHWSSDVIIGALTGSLTAHLVSGRHHREGARPVLGANAEGALVLGVRW